MAQHILGQSQHELSSWGWGQEPAWTQSEERACQLGSSCTARGWPWMPLTSVYCDQKGRARAGGKSQGQQWRNTARQVRIEIHILRRGLWYPVTG